MQRVIREGQDATGQITLLPDAADRPRPAFAAGVPACPAGRQRVEMTFITATTLPLLIALAEIGMQDGVMLPATAAALVGAGVLSVLIFPLVAVRLHRTAPLTPADVGITQGTDPDDPPVARPVR
jgi:hypothetical protein